MTESSSDESVSIAPLPAPPPLRGEVSSSGVSDLAPGASGGTAIGSTISTMSEGFAPPRRRVPVWSVLLGLVLVVGTVGAFVVMKRVGGGDASRSAVSPTDQTAPTAPNATSITSTATVAPIDADPTGAASLASASASARPLATGAPAAVQAQPRPPAAPGPKPGNCNPNYFIDGKGVKRYKKECLK